MEGKQMHTILYLSVVNKWKNYRPWTFRNVEIDISLTLSLTCLLEHYCVPATRAAEDKDLERVN